MRLRDVPSTIGWGAVALFLRHLPYDSETMREMCPGAAWSDETHMLASIYDLVGDLFAQDYKHLDRPGVTAPYSSAEMVGQDEMEALMARFGGGAHDG